MAVAGLPGDGELQLGSVMLPAGRRYFTSDEPPEAAAWITRLPVPDPGGLWLALSAMHPETGLVPFLVPGPEGGWGEPTIVSRCDVAEVDHASAAAVLSGLWEEETYPGWEDSEPEFAAQRAPYGGEFPGLAVGEDTALSSSDLRGAIGSLAGDDLSPGPFRLGLAVAGRPADLLPAVGWGFQHSDLLPTVSLTAVLRSWEDRFGARVIHLGPDTTIKLLVERPPRTFEAAQALAAEHYVLCDETEAGASCSVREIAQALLGAPIWRLWWD